MSRTHAFLTYLPKVSPKVEDICIRKPCARPIDIHPLLGYVHLRSVSISRIRVSTVESVLKLAQLPRLEKLSLFFIHSPASENPSPNRSSPYVFHQVTSLECNSAPEFLQAARFPVLQSFSIKDESSLRIRASLNALWKHCSPDILSKIFVACLQRRDLEPALTLEDIQTVYKFQRLKWFDVRATRWIWNDQELERMASAWPRLTKLTVYSTMPKYLEPEGFTLLGLVHLVKCCPRLSSLSIRICEQHPPVTLSDLPEDGSSNLRLQTISFSDAQLEQSQYDTVAAFLSSLFPNLRRIESPFTTHSSHCWKRVERLLGTFSKGEAYTQRE